MLVTYGADDLEDRGFAASLVFDPDPASARGLSLGLPPGLGGAAQGGLEALFAPEALEDRSGFEAGASGDAESRWQTEAAYSLPVFGGRFTGSPHMGLGLATGARNYTLGWRLTPGAASAPDLSFGVRAMHRESDLAAPGRTLGFEAAIEKDGKRVTTRTHVAGQVGKVFQAVGIALPPNWREHTA